ncbi:hypothetical protein QYZ43_16255 [Vibrio parahaemolyticus]|nr:hypothetical protein [Vibrio parahaemolyticus]MDN4718812.1 hypothetical protein [Vibrio parahaemolyticus]MDN4720589.1 hypothetical protein [Vibrio parahaemolyticus]MDN4726336.1 hypothetical protein [Vibrio parahaemolyticus]MDN4728321.1 hypothetical protein [Vibrio parahaemolyticus]
MKRAETQVSAFYIALSVIVSDYVKSDINSCIWQKPVPGEQE